MKDALLVLSAVALSVLFCFLLAMVWWGCVNPVREIVEAKHPDCEIVRIDKGPQGVQRITIYCPDTKEFETLNYRPR